MTQRNDQGKDKQFGYRDEHWLILEKIPPESVVRLRELIAKPEHHDLYIRAIKGSTFEECIGILAACLDIALDGLYEASDLCEMLCDAINKRHTVDNKPWIANSHLISAELVERQGELSLEENPNGEMGTLVPSDKKEIN